MAATLALMPCHGQQSIALEYAALQSGVPQPLSISMPGQTPRFQITVPFAATAMAIRLEPTTTGTDLDLDVLVEDNPVLSLNTPDTNGESFTFTASSNPGLRSTTYFFVVRRVRPLTSVAGRLTVTISGGTPATPPPVVFTRLISGQAQAFNLGTTRRASFFVSPIFAYEVLPGTTNVLVRLDVDRFSGENPTVQIYRRLGEPPALTPGGIAAYETDTLFPNATSFSSTTGYFSGASAPVGTNFVAFSVNGPSAQPVVGRLTISWSGAGAPAARQLTSGQAVPFSLPRPYLSTLVVGGAYQITVPEGTASLAVRTITSTPAADVDLYVRQGVPAEIDNTGRVLADAQSLTAGSGNETVLLNGQSSPVLRPGIYYATLYVKATNTPVEGTITATLGAAPPPGPLITLGGPALNAASFQPSISPGSWTTLRGTNLAPVTRVWAAGDFKGNKLPVALDGVSVTVNGQNAGIYFISPTQINMLAPDVSATGEVPVAVTTQGVTVRTTATLRRFAPAFFTLGAGSPPYVAAVHADGTLVGSPGILGSDVATRPARPGDRILLYGTGFGPTNPASPSDELVAGPVATANRVTIRAGDRMLPVEFAGLVSPGLYQFNVVIPDDLAPGEYRATADVGDGTTLAAASLTIGARQ